MSWAEAYITDQLEAKYEVIRRSGSWLQQRIEELRRRRVTHSSRPGLQD